MRQLFMGQQIRNKTEIKPRVSLKQVPNHDLTNIRAVRCGCEVTQSRTYVDFEGKCQLNMKQQLEDLSSYACSFQLDPRTIENNCNQQSRFNCIQTFDDEYDELTIEANEKFTYRPSLNNVSMFETLMDHNPAFDLKFQDHNTKPTTSIIEATTVAAAATTKIYQSLNSSTQARNISSEDRISNSNCVNGDHHRSKLTIISMVTVLANIFLL